jgi:hypothetical protein
MRIQFNLRKDGPERLLAEAEIVFDEGLLAGCKLVGFCVWKGADGEARVTVPARAFGLGGDRRYFDLVRNADGEREPVKKLKAAILERFAVWAAPNHGGVGV